jgi:hypothetical protein
MESGTFLIARGPPVLHFCIYGDVWDRTRDLLNISLRRSPNQEIFQLFTILATGWAATPLTGAKTCMHVFMQSGDIT